MPISLVFKKKSETDKPMAILSYRDERLMNMNIKKWEYIFCFTQPPLLHVWSKLSILLVFDKSDTHQFTDGPTNGQTEPLIEMLGHILYVYTPFHHSIKSFEVLSTLITLVNSK